MDPLRRNLVALAVLAGLSAVQARAAEGWGTLKGQVVYPGPAPAREKIDVKQDKDHCLSKGPLYSEEYVVNLRNNGVRNVFVWLIDASGSHSRALPVHPSLKDAKLTDAVMDQPCCQFVPHVIALREGQGLVFKNSAPVAHNVRVLGGVKGPELNVVLPPSGRKEVPAADLPARPTPIAVECNIHPWMRAWVRVFPHPYFGVTDADGNFTIKNAPAGEYRVVMWHEGEGWVNGDKKGTPITIKDGGETDLGKVPLKKAPAK
jgi:hypothetical protein